MVSGLSPASSSASGEISAETTGDGHDVGDE